MGEDDLRKELAGLVLVAINEYARSTRGANQITKVVAAGISQVHVTAKNGKTLGIVVGKFKRDA